MSSQSETEPSPLTLHAINPLPGLRASLEAGDDKQREVIYREQVMEPLRPFWEPFLRYMPSASASGGDGKASPLAAAQAFAYYTPDLGIEQGREALAQLERADTFRACTDAVQESWERLDPFGHGISLGEITFTFMLGSPTVMNRSGGYTGSGGQPGIVMVMGWPSEFTLPCLPAATAHEVNHNVRFSFEPFRMHETTVGQYIVAEGLAEAFAAEMFGEEGIGPWAQALSEEQIEAVRPRFRDAIEVSGFDEIRGYIFGDWAAEQHHYKPQGLPDFAGYTIGYRVVKAFIANTGTTAAQATYVPWQEIVQQSRYFV